MASFNKEGSAAAQTKQDLYRRKLSEISNIITDEELLQLKFCCDFIPDGTSEKIKTAEKLFQELERRNKLSSNKVDFLIDLLLQIGLDTLAQDLKELNHNENLTKVYTYIYGSIKIA
jgi:hypothetical protein